MGENSQTEKNHLAAVPRFRVVWAYRARGLTYANIGARLGVSESRAAQLYWRAEQCLLYHNWHQD